MLPSVFTIVYVLICFFPFKIEINKEFNEYSIIVIPKILIGLAYNEVVNINLERKAPKNNKTRPTKPEQYKLILKEVLNNDFNFTLSPSYSAVYLTTPVLIAPFAKVRTILIKFEKAPSKATPPVPVYIATTLLATNPEEIRIKLIIPEKKVVLINFKMKFKMY